jgi:hypothetical protein
MTLELQTRVYWRLYRNIIEKSVVFCYVSKSNEPNLLYIYTQKKMMNFGRKKIKNK